MWWTGVHSYNTVNAIRDCTRPLPYRAPSWSWASVEDDFSGIIRYAQHDSCSTIESITIHHATVDIYGEVLSATLRAKGPLLRCERDACGAFSGGMLITSSTQPYHEIHVDIRPGFLFDVKTDAVASQIYMFPLHYRSGTLPSSTNLSGLLLLPTDREGCYERCGIYQTSTKNLQSFWGEAKARAKIRMALRPEGEPFEITYITGPADEKRPERLFQPFSPQDESGKGKMPATPTPWKEYEEFDGFDCTFSIV